MTYTTFQRAYFHIKTVPVFPSNSATIFFSADDSVSKRETFTLLSDNEGDNEIFIPKDLTIWTLIGNIKMRLYFGEQLVHK